jgi:c-di-GMP-binding flagellar brake protein YcgR
MTDDMIEVDLRISPRKVFRCRAKLALDGKPSIDAWTIDISPGGMSLMLAEPTDPGQYCVIRFETTINGVPRSFSAIARSVYSVCSFTGQYRIGFQFVQLSAANAAMIDEMPL